MSVLITAASHSAAYKLERLLRAPNLVFADFIELPHLTRSGRNFVKIPKGNSASFAHQILDLALNEGIIKILPLYADEIFPLAESRQLFLEYGISVIVPNINWFEGQSLIQNASDTSLIVMESGKILAGELPPGVTLADEELSGIFKVGIKEGRPLLTLFTVQP